MSTKPRAYLVGGGIGSLAAAAFMIRDGGVPGGNISILEAAPLMGGSLDGAGNLASGYSMRGGRMLTTDNYECTWDLYKSIPSLTQKARRYLTKPWSSMKGIKRIPWRGWLTGGARSCRSLRWGSPYRTESSVLVCAGSAPIDAALSRPLEIRSIVCPRITIDWPTEGERRGIASNVPAHTISTRPASGEVSAPSKLPAYIERIAASITTLKADPKSERSVPRAHWLMSKLCTKIAQFP
jgi:MCRA family